MNLIKVYAMGLFISSTFSGKNHGCGITSQYLHIAYRQVSNIRRTLVGN